MKFKTKLYVGLGFILSLIVILLWMLLNMLSQLNQNMHHVVKERYEMVRLANIVVYELNVFSRESRGLAANPPPELRETLIENREKALLNANMALSSLEQLDTSDKSRELVQKLKALSQNYNQIRTKSDELNLDLTQGSIEFMWYDGREVREQMQVLIEELRTFQEQDMEAALNKSQETYQFAVKVISIYIVVWLLIAIGVSIWLIRSISSNLGKVTSVMSSFAYGETEKLPRIEIAVRDEIGAIAEAFNAMATTLEQHARQEKELMEAAQQQSWLKTKVAEIATMYAGVQDLQTLAQLFIAKITPMVGASYGVFYIKGTEESDSSLYKMAAYADTGQDIGKDRFQLGEGLVGQCALENHIIQLTHLPDRYITISSGTGNASPTAVIILPAEYEGEVLAVIELASFEPFCPLHQMVLQEVMANVGITIHSITNHMKVERLLQESQALTEELQRQSEELQMQQEELRTINEELEEQYEHSQQKSQELEKVRLVLEEKAQQLTQSSQYKSEFLANMSHELRTPLNSLLILAQMLAQNQEGNLTDKQVEFARTIFSSGNDLLLLINDILDLAKVEAGKMDVFPESIEVREVQSFIEGQFTPLANKKGIAFNVQLASDLPDMFYTDKHRLLQILKNLLSNAFKFTKQGHVRMQVRRSEGTLAFSVSDTGIGIPQNKLNIIFEAFQQANGTTSRHYGGTGLGLSISREIAQLLGGRIEVKSIEGIGSTFTLYLPIHDDAWRLKELSTLTQEAAASSIMEAEPSQLLESVVDVGSGPMKESLLVGKKVLIVDDDMRNIFALTTAFESYQMEVIFAENGKEGIKALKENPDTHLVLMDIMMPEMDGFDTMRNIRKIQQFQSLPIIALTAKAMKSDREQCIDAGASDYISKPINLEQLLSLMRVWLYK
ncbi:ATP-binding protein [Ammoniphilus sp. 3BR4]|uniref:ATP-binding protein n=1 Tax=Ammoniphilus sp. 3BR4 TaxID=3158265 RepID=UPI003465F15A